MKFCLHFSPLAGADNAGEGTERRGCVRVRLCRLGLGLGLAAGAVPNADVSARGLSGSGPDGPDRPAVHRLLSVRVRPVRAHTRRAQRRLLQLQSAAHARADAGRHQK